MPVSWWHHLFQHVLQSLSLKIDHKLLLLSPVQILQQSSVTGIVEVFDADGADLPVVLSCLLHDGLQDGVSWQSQTHRTTDIRAGKKKTEQPGIPRNYVCIRQFHTSQFPAPANVHCQCRKKCLFNKVVSDCHVFFNHNHDNFLTHTVFVMCRYYAFLVWHEGWLKLCFFFVC